MKDNSIEEQFISEICNDSILKCFKCKQRIPLINNLDFNNSKGIYITIICQCDNKNFSCSLHELVSLIKKDNMPIKDIIVSYKCFIHKEMNISLYCNDCSIGICYKCSKKHKTHHIFTINELWLSIRKSLQFSKERKFQRETHIKKVIQSNPELYEDMISLTNIIYGMFYKESSLKYDYIICRNMIYYESCIYENDCKKKPFEIMNNNTLQRTISRMKNYLKGNNTIKRTCTFVKVLNPQLVLYYDSNINKIYIENIIENNTIIIDSPSMLLLDNCFTNNSNKFALTINSIIYLYNSPTEMTTIDQKTNSKIISIIFLKTDQIISILSDQTIRIYNTSSSICLYHQETNSYYMTLLPLLGFALVKSNNTIIVFPDLLNKNNTQIIKELIGSQSMIYKIIEIKEGKELASCSCDKDIIIWDIKLCIHNHSLLGHSKSVNDIIELYDKRLASCSHDHSVKLWDMNDYTCTSTLLCHDTAVIYLRQLFNENLFTVSINNDIIIYE